MPKGAKMLRRTAVLAAGLALTASVGLAGTGAASGASSAAIANHSKWTTEINGVGCEIEQFVTSNSTFTGDFYGDAGTWSGGTTSVKMKWTAGGESGLTFKGTYNSSLKAFVGHFGAAVSGLTGQLVKGAVSSFEGVRC
jgi:hypothetical protein